MNLSKHNHKTTPLKKKTAGFHRIFSVIFHEFLWFKWDDDEIFRVAKLGWFSNLRHPGWNPVAGRLSPELARILQRWMSENEWKWSPFWRIHHFCGFGKSRLVATQTFRGFHPENWGRFSPILTMIFFKGVGEKPPTRNTMKITLPKTGNEQQVKTPWKYVRFQGRPKGNVSISSFEKISGVWDVSFREGR